MEDVVELRVQLYCHQHEPSHQWCYGLCEDLGGREQSEGQIPELEGLS